MKILPIYAALLTLFFVFLSVNVIRTRRRHQVGLGHAENQLVLRAIRVQGNFAEYVPLALLLIFLVETSAGSPALVHSLGGLLLAGRLLHAFGVSHEPENFKYRVVGMTLTFTVLLTSACYLLVQAIAG